MEYGSVCSGIEAASVAWEPLGWRPVWFSEIEAFPSAVLKSHWPKVPNIGDMTLISGKIRRREVRAPDILVGGTPCFTAGHLILTATGYKAIDDVMPGDLVVTHLGCLKKVTRIGSKDAEVGILSAVGQPAKIMTTPDHPFLSVDYRRQNTHRNGERAIVEHCGDLKWTAAKEMRGQNWCALVNYQIEQDVSLPPRFAPEVVMYLAGMYLGDGYIREWAGKNKKTVVFGLNAAKVDRLLAVVSREDVTIANDRTSIKVSIYDTELANWLELHFGRMSNAKRISPWVFSSTLRHHLLRGYLDTNGNRTKNGFVANSVSKALAYGVVDLANCCDYVAAASFVKTSDTTVIEGRIVNQQNYWSVKAVYSHLSRKSRVRHGYRLRRASTYVAAGIETVYNIEVEDDNSFILNGAVVNNCQAFSMAGLRQGLSDARGQLTLAYVELLDEIDRTRLADGLPPCIAVWENVPGVLSTDDNAFGCFLAALAGDDEPLEPGPRPEHGRSSAHWTWNNDGLCQQRRIFQFGRPRSSGLHGSLCLSAPHREEWSR